MIEPDHARTSQLELLVRQVVEALGREPEKQRVLVFDTALAGRFTGLDHEVIVARPEGRWPRGASFDVVLCTGLLERVEDDRATLRRIRGALKPTGQALIAVPLARPGCAPPAKAVRHYAVEELTSALLRTGLSVAQVLAEGPELLISQAAPSTAIGAETIARADAAIAAKSWDEAERLLSSITEQMEDELLVRELAMLVGHLHLARGRLSAALEAFEQASGLGGASVQPLTGLGAVALAAGDLEAAAEIFGAALEYCPTSFAALRGMGMVKQALGDKEGALTSFDMAASQRPGDREIAEQVVDLAVEVGWSGSARQAIDRRVGVTGDDAWALRVVTEKLRSLDPSSSQGCQTR
jgi:tetratricopeptide (TPR) repeat protein